MQAAPAPTRRWRNVPLVRERDVRRTRSLWILLLGLAAAVAPLAFYLLQQMAFVQVRYAIEEKRAERRRLEEDERWLRIERAARAAFPMVERAVAARSGDEPPLTRAVSRNVVVVRQAAAGRGTAAPRAPARNAR